MSEDTPAMEPLKRCECGCGQITPRYSKTDTARGWVKGEPARFVHGHSAPRDTGPDHLEDPETGCWVWQRATEHGGYGMLRRDGEVMAHRWYYRQHIGPIPDGYEVDHLCANRACVNPEHLEAVTPAENRRRSGSQYVPPAVVEEARQLADKGVSYREIGRRLDINWSTARRYALGLARSNDG